jgi:hypothetical protein
MRRPNRGTRPATGTGAQRVRIPNKKRGNAAGTVSGGWWPRRNTSFGKRIRVSMHVQWQRLVLGGWNISTVTSFQSGQTLSLSATNNVGVRSDAQPASLAVVQCSCILDSARIHVRQFSRTVPNLRGPPATNASLATFGTITSTLVNPLPRNIRLSMCLNF